MRAERAAELALECRARLRNGAYSDEGDAIIQDAILAAAAEARREALTEAIVAINGLAEFAFMDTYRECTDAILRLRDSAPREGER